jgi:hypothetical protein
MYWKDRHLTLEIKRQLFSCSIIPVLLYGAETWSLQQADMPALESFVGNSCMAMCYRTKWDYGTHEGYRLRVGEPRAAWRCRSLHLQWLGHMLRMPSSPGRLPMQALLGWPAHDPLPREDARRTGWRPTIKIELRDIRVGWAQVFLEAQNKAGWREICKTPLELEPEEARTCTRCLTPFITVKRRIRHEIRNQCHAPVPNALRTKAKGKRKSKVKAKPKPVPMPKAKPKPKPKAKRARAPGGAAPEALPGSKRPRLAQAAGPRHNPILPEFIAL